MKRSGGLFLLAVIIAVSLGATVVVSLAMDRLFTRLQAQALERLETSLSDRFAIFETMLRGQNSRMHEEMAKVLPEIAAELDRTGRKPEDLSTEELDALTKKYGVEHIYFIDRAYKVFQTNLASDMNLVFPKGEFTHFLSDVFDSGEVMSDGIDLSSVTGTLRTYSYFGPKDKDYIIETSNDVRANLGRSNFGWMSKLVFEDMFADAVRSNPFVKDVDIYLINSSGAWSLLHVGRKLASDLAETVTKTDRYEDADPDGRHVTTYGRYVFADAARKGEPLSRMLVIRKITYDTGLAREAVVQVFTSAMIVLALMLPVVFWIASRLLQRHLLDPLFNLRSEAGAIAGGNLDQAIASTERRDELGQLAQSFASMRDSVRRTILDLKTTNQSIERFVPKAFLAIMGKPSIVDVGLGDNKRRDMTVLFSDIRDFTTLSEKMTPDANFAFINAYLERMGPVIRTHGGFIDKYIGDAIMALFETADDALRASLDMLETLDRFNADRGTSGQAPIAIGIGLNSGSLMMGTIGEQHRMDGTVISDAVNLASRIESLTKVYRMRLLISQYTYEQLSDPAARDIRPIDVVIVKGKTRPITIYEVYERDASADRATKGLTRDLLLRGVEALSRHDTTAARQSFLQCLALVPGDPAATNLMKSCA